MFLSVYSPLEKQCVMKLYIKHMVSLRCKMQVEKELEKLGVTCSSVNLGMVEVPDCMTDGQLEIFNENLKKCGLELLKDPKYILVEKIKNVVVEMIHYADELPQVNDSEFISKKLGYNYTYLSNVFSEVKGMTIQQYIIRHKIEKVKELMLYDELTLTEMAYKMNYSSVAHLSNQFKKVTGFPPTAFKQENTREHNLEDL